MKSVSADSPSVETSCALHWILSHRDVTVADVFTPGLFTLIFTKKIM